MPALIAVIKTKRTSASTKSTISSEADQWVGTRSPFRKTERGQSPGFSLGRDE